MVHNKEQKREYMRKMREQVRQYIMEQKNKPCHDCGLSFPPVCMDYHHDGDKNFEIGASTNTTINLEKIQTEIDKCVLLCACCHRLRHVDD